MPVGCLRVVVARIDAEKYLRDLEREVVQKEEKESQRLTFMQFVPD